MSTSRRGSARWARSTMRVLPASPLILTAGQQEQGHGLTEPVLYGPLSGWRSLW
jgi:hypothetical protein